MIPHTIHYCWFGGPMTARAQECIDSWHRHMPGWEYKLWNEENFDIDSTTYTREAYASGKYAFVSDYVRLWALYNEGGVYLDTDVQTLKPFDPLMEFDAFAGFEGSKHLPVGTCVLASRPGGQWVTEMLSLYDGLHFLNPDGTPDLTTNVQRLTAAMKANGLRTDGHEQQYKDLHIFPVEYFSPRHTTGEYICTADTYCDHLGLGSWGGKPKGWKQHLRLLVGQRAMTFFIKAKRRLEQ